MKIKNYALLAIVLIISACGNNLNFKKSPELKVAKNYYHIRTSDFTKNGVSVKNQEFNNKNIIVLCVQPNSFNNQERLETLESFHRLILDLGEEQLSEEVYFNGTLTTLDELADLIFSSILVLRRSSLDEMKCPIGVLSETSAYYLK